MDHWIVLSVNGNSPPKPQYEMDCVFLLNVVVSKRVRSSSSCFPANMSLCWLTGIPSLSAIIPFRSATVWLLCTQQVIVLPVSVFTNICIMFFMIMNPSDLLSYLSQLSNYYLSILLFIRIPQTSSFSIYFLFFLRFFTSIEYFFLAPLFYPFSCIFISFNQANLYPTFFFQIFLFFILPLTLLF